MGEDKKYYIEKEGVKEMPWSTFFQRTADVPLDRSSMFSSLEDAQKYAKGDELTPDDRNLVSTSYIGQIITVYENDEVIVYKINNNRELEPLDKSTIVIQNDEELTKISLSKNNVGQMVYKLDNKTIYFVSEKEKNCELFSFNDGIATLDAGTY